MSYTELKKPVNRKVSNIDRGLIVTLYPGGVLGLRPIRTKRTYTIHLATCYQLAIQQHFTEVARQKKAAKTARRKAARR